MVRKIQLCCHKSRNRWVRQHSFLLEARGYKQKYVACAGLITRNRTSRPPDLGPGNGFEAVFHRLLFPYLSCLQLRWDWKENTLWLSYIHITAVTLDGHGDIQGFFSIKSKQASACSLCNFIKLLAVSRAAHNSLPFCLIVRHIFSLIRTKGYPYGQ